MLIQTNSPHQVPPIARARDLFGFQWQRNPNSVRVFLSVLILPPFHRVLHTSLSRTFLYLSTFSPSLYSVYIHYISSHKSPTTTMTTQINVRPPSTRSRSSSARASPDQPQQTEQAVPPPSPNWLQGTWHVTHSTLPIWKTKRNVRISYTILPSSTRGTTKLLDAVTFQTPTLNKVGTLRGIDTADPTVEGRWNWRGKGWLRVASSQWEILGHGEYVDVIDGKEMTNRWIVTYFSRSCFSPAGMDLYSRDETGLKGEVVWDIKQALDRMGDARVRKLVGKLFRVKHDTARD